MLTLLVRRFVILISSSALNPNADALNSLLSGIRTTSADTISTMQSQEFPDLAQVLINSMIGNITLVAQQMLKENLQNQSSQALTYVIALAVINWLEDLTFNFTFFSLPLVFFSLLRFYKVILLI